MMGDDQTQRTDRYEGFEGTVGRVFATSQPWWPPRPTAPEGAPNIVLMLVDDMGYSDMGCFGSEIPTPHIDATAAEGLRLTNFHVAPLCSPSRASLMTGLNPHAAGMGQVAHIDAGFPGYTGELPRNQPSIAEMFRDAGYATMALGKWHLCKNADLSEAGDKHSWPMQRGFEQYYGFLEALTNFHHPHRMYEGNAVITTDQYPDDYYLTDDLTNRAVQMIREVKTANPDKPFFMYYAHGAVHAPLHAKRADIEAHRDRYAAGWDAIREQRLQRQIAAGIVPDGTTLPPRNSEPGEDVQAWDDLSDDEKMVFARYMECYAAMMTSIDDSLGAIRDELAAIGQLENTIIIVTSDNGASREGRNSGSMAYYRDGGRVAGQTTDITEALERFDEIGGPTNWPHYPRGWAMACNTPFRLYKISTFRGGHSAPMVFSWPRRLSDAGAIRHQYTHISDMLPTLAELAGVDIPTHRNGVAADPLDGVSFVPLLDDPDAEQLHGDQYYECIGHRAYHRGEWHAVTFHEPRTAFSDDRWQLFNSVDDINEIDDLADQHPDKVVELRDAWEQAAWANAVFPLEDGTGISKLYVPDYAMPDTEPCVIRPGTPTIERFRSSRLIAQAAFDIDVALVHRREDQGILVAHGGQESGYVLWIEDGHVGFELNLYGQPERVGLAPFTGHDETTITVHVALTDDGTWNIGVDIDGAEVFRRDNVPRFASSYLPFEGIDIGLDRRSPVSWDLYTRHGAFPYSGTITSVTYTPTEISPATTERRLEELRALGSALE